MAHRRTYTHIQNRPKSIHQASPSPVHRDSCKPQTTILNSQNHSVPTINPQSTPNPTPPLLPPTPTHTTTLPTQAPPRTLPPIPQTLPPTPAPFAAQTPPPTLPLLPFPRRSRTTTLPPPLATQRLFQPCGRKMRVEVVGRIVRRRVGRPVL